MGQEMTDHAGPTVDRPTARTANPARSQATTAAEPVAALVAEALDPRMFLGADGYGDRLAPPPVNAAQRSQAVLHLQRTVGNAAVARLLQWQQPTATNLGVVFNDTLARRAWQGAARALAEMDRGTRRLAIEALSADARGRVRDAGAQLDPSPANPATQDIDAVEPADHVPRGRQRRCLTPAATWQRWTPPTNPSERWTSRRSTSPRTSAPKSRDCLRHNRSR
jgi:hypothetical protein